MSDPAERLREIRAEVLKNLEESQNLLAEVDAVRCEAARMPSYYITGRDSWYLMPGYVPAPPRRFDRQRVWIAKKLRRLADYFEEYGT